MIDSEYFQRACDSAREFAEVSATNAELVRAIPAIDILLYAAALEIKGELTDEVGSHLGAIFTQIIPLAEQASDGDEKALTALRAIDSLSTPNLFNISTQTLKELADRAYKSWFARAVMLVELMNDLSWVVEPARSNAKTMRTGPVRPFTSLSQEIIQGARLWTEESLDKLHKQAIKHCRKNTTLQALAIKVYNDIEEREGFEPKEERVLKRDLQRFKEWIAEHPSEAPASAWWSLRGEEESLYE